MLVWSSSTSGLVVHRMEEIGSLSELGVEKYLNLHLRRWDHHRPHFECCIYVVPNSLRKSKEEAYTPRLVSIGPLHRGKKHLQAMEANKLRYVSSFLIRLNQSIDFYVQLGKTWEEEARECYQNIIQLSSDEFVYMILVDGIFIVELLMRNYYHDIMREEYDDDVFQKQWMRRDLLHDIILLENQLPFFILERLFRTTEFCCERGKPAFYVLAYRYFDYAVNLKTCYESQCMDDGSTIKHVVDLLYSFYWPSNSIALRHYGHNSDDFEYTRSAAELLEAGVKFKVIEDSAFPVDIKFTDGVLEIPCLRVNEWTESFFRNVIAYEQCHHRDTIVSSYIMLMDCLINSPKDVDVLVKSHIIENSLGSSENVCLLFNSLYNFKATMSGRQFYYKRLCEDLNAYRRSKWNQWKATWYRWKQILRRDYLSNPWTTISVIAAVLLLGLSVIQAVCSVIALKQNCN